MRGRVCSMQAPVCLSAGLLNTGPALSRPFPALSRRAPALEQTGPALEQTGLRWRRACRQTAQWGAHNILAEKLWQTCEETEKLRGGSRLCKPPLNVLTRDARVWKGDPQSESCERGITILWAQESSILEQNPGHSRLAARCARTIVPQFRHDNLECSCSLVGVDATTVQWFQHPCLWQQAVAFAVGSS